MEPKYSTEAMSQGMRNAAETTLAKAQEAVTQYMKEATRVFSAVDFERPSDAGRSPRLTQKAVTTPRRISPRLSTSPANCCNAKDPQEFSEGSAGLRAEAGREPRRRRSARWDRASPASRIERCIERHFPKGSAKSRGRNRTPGRMAEKASMRPTRIGLTQIRERLFTSVIGDVMDMKGLRQQFLPPHIRALAPEMMLVGRAMPVREEDCATQGDFGLMFKALDDLQARRGLYLHGRLAPDTRSGAS